MAHPPRTGTQKALRITSIIMIIFGVLVALSGAIIIASGAAADSLGLNDAVNFQGTETTAGILTMAVGILVLIMGALQLIVAFLDMVENHKMIVENSGLLTVAALRHLDFKNKKVVSILSGGNMDVITMSSVVRHGLIQRDRIFTVSVLLPDKPGELVRVASVIAEQQGNVIKLDHNQFVSVNRNAAVELKITLEAFGTEHKERIVEALKKEGYKPKLTHANL